MLRTMIIYGFIAGVVVIANIVIGFTLSGGEGAGASTWFGYLIMLVALSVIFFAIKNYRDKTQGGVISFKTAALLGLGVSAFAGLSYAIGWEGFLAATDYAFIEQYSAGMIEAKKAAGLTGEALADAIANVEKFTSQYRNPLYRFPVTFMEIFPVGVLVTLVSAALLRNSRFLPARG